MCVCVWSPLIRMIAQLFFFHISALERYHLIGLFIVLCLLLFSSSRCLGRSDYLYAVNKPASIPNQGVTPFIVSERRFNEETNFVGCQNLNFRLYTARFLAQVSATILLASKKKIISIYTRRKTNSKLFFQKVLDWLSLSLFYVQPSTNKRHFSFFSFFIYYSSVLLSTSPPSWCDKNRKSLWSFFNSSQKKLFDEKLSFSQLHFV